jgi:glyoxylase-like metal-dependent hydrolase (beta-lactamase superfamily II)
MYANQAFVEPFFDEDSSTYSYVVYDQEGGSAAIVDPVLSFNPASASTSTKGADTIIAFLRSKALKLEWILETHAHADHLSAAPYLRCGIGGKTGIGAGIDQVQSVFNGIYNLTGERAATPELFDHLFADEEVFSVGTLQVRVMAVPGHTPADVAYVLGDAVFVGDTLFMPDVGTARCDFPGGDARALYASTQRLLALPSNTKTYVCHDYAPKSAAGVALRSHQCFAHVASQRASNIHVREGISEAEFVAMRQARDATLGMPGLMLPAIQVNLRAGQLPSAEANGTSYLKIPMNAFKVA